MELIMSNLGHDMAEVLATKKSRAELFTTIFEICPTPIVVTNGDGSLVYANRSYLFMLGAIIEEVRGEGWRDFIDPASRERIFNRWAEALLGKDPDYGQLIDFQRKDGSRFSLHFTVRKFNGNFIGFGTCGLEAGCPIINVMP